MNCSVVTGGSLKVEVLNANGVVVPGYSEADCDVIQGDHVDQVVTWGAQTALPATVNPIRLRFLMQDASLYSFMPGEAVQFWAEPAAPTLAVLYDFEGETGQAASEYALLVFWTVIIVLGSIEALRVALLDGYQDIATLICLPIP